jgi:hypothetical protein
MWTEMAIVHYIVLGDAAILLVPMLGLWSILLNSHSWIKAGMKNSFTPTEDQRTTNIFHESYEISKYEMLKENQTRPYNKNIQTNQQM